MSNRDNSTQLPGRMAGSQTLKCPRSEPQPRDSSTTVRMRSTQFSHAVLRSIPRQTLRNEVKDPAHKAATNQYSSQSNARCFHSKAKSASRLMTHSYKRPDLSSKANAPASSSGGGIVCRPPLASPMLLCVACACSSCTV